MPSKCRGERGECPNLEVRSPFRHGGHDAVLLGKPESEPRVISRIAEENHKGLVECVGCAEHRVHQGLAEAAPLVVGMHAERPDCEHRS